MEFKNEPIDYTKFNERFPTEADCLNYLFALRWPDGYYCPRCACKNMWQISPYKYKCRQCKYQTSVTAGTAFHHSHISMRQWFKAIWYMSERKNKATACELQNDVEIGSNRTALSMINKIESEMFTNDDNKINRSLNGTIDICIDTRNNFLTAVEIPDFKNGHIRLYILPQYSQECFQQFLLENVESESNIKRERGHWKLGRIHGYTFNTKNPEYYEAPYANAIFQNFKQYYHQKKTEYSKSSSPLKIMNDYVRLINSFTYDITFDGIIYNFLNYMPRENPLKNIRLK
ncbi:MAG: transposase [Clostridiales bacterium]|nr:transposase [Clostridiales bacterium]